MITFLLRGPTSGEYVTPEDCKIVILTMLRSPSGMTKIVSKIKMYTRFVKFRRGNVTSSGCSISQILTDLLNNLIIVLLLMYSYMLEFFYK